MKLTQGIIAAIIAIGIYIAIASLYRHGFTAQVGKEGAVIGVVTFIIALIVSSVIAKKKKR